MQQKCGTLFMIVIFSQNFAILGTIFGIKNGKSLANGQMPFFFKVFPKLKKQ